MVDSTSTRLIFIYKIYKVIISHIQIYLHMAWGCFGVRHTQRCRVDKRSRTCLSLLYQCNTPNSPHARPLQGATGLASLVLHHSLGSHLVKNTIPTATALNGVMWAKRLLVTARATQVLDFNHSRPVVFHRRAYIYYI
jgi:hypothetical protein